MRKLVVLAALAASAFVTASLAQAASPILPVSQVKPGMKGVGRSVFAGGKVEEFQADVIGILENVQGPKRNVILARLSGRNLESTGVIAGMSGSPVYVDGKIIGAVAFSFAFAKEPIAGITPIEEMLAIREKEGVRPPASLPFNLPLTGALSLEDLSRAMRQTLPAVRPAAADGRALQALQVPLVMSGFSAGAFDRAGSFFAGLGFQPVRGGTAAQASSTAAPAAGQAAGTAPAAAPSAPPVLAEGDAVALQLISGDLDMSAVGTVTYVDGGKIFAFGHPMYNLGSVEYGMAKADVMAVVPSLESSFKLAATGPTVGRFTQDRTAGGYGEVGTMPKTIPLNVTLETGPGVRREFHLNLVDDRILSPALANMALYSLVTGEERVFGDVSLDFDADLFLDNGPSVHLEDLFSGNYNNASTDLSGLIAAVVYLLKNNEFQNVGIYRMDLHVRAAEEARACLLERVLLDTYEAAPGERIKARISYRSRRDGPRTEEVEIPVPALPPGSEFQVVVGDAATMQAIERSTYRAQDFVPRSLPQLIRLLGNLRKNNRIYVKVQASRPGLFLKGEEMPNLPPTLKDMFLSPRTPASSPTEITRSTLSEYQLVVPYVFRGAAVVPVKIRG